MRSSAIPASIYPVLMEGIAIPTPTFTNVGKLYSNMHFHDVVRDLIDIAGGNNCYNVSRRRSEKRGDC